MFEKKKAYRYSKVFDDDDVDKEKGNHGEKDDANDGEGIDNYIAMPLILRI